MSDLLAFFNAELGNVMNIFGFPITLEEKISAEKFSPRHETASRRTSVSEYQSDDFSSMWSIQHVSPPFHCYLLYKALSSLLDCL